MAVTAYQVCVSLLERILRPLVFGRSSCALTPMGRRCHMKRWSVIGTALFAVGSLAGGALAVGPSKADTEFCNQRAAQATKPSPVQPSTSNQAAMPPAPGRQSEASKPGTPVSPGQAVQPAPPTPRQGYN